jgi:hypothetical protein
MNQAVLQGKLKVEMVFLQASQIFAAINAVSRQGALSTR